MMRNDFLKLKTAAAFVVCSVCVFALLGPAEAQARQTLAATSDFRTWTDSTGVFSVEAKLLGVKDGKAELEKKDGLVVKLPLEKLRPADRTFVAKQIAKAMDPANPFAGGEPAASKNPFESAGGDSGSSKTSNETKSSPNIAAPKSIPTATRIKVDVARNEIEFADDGWHVPSGPAVKKEANVPAVVLAYPSSIEHAFHDRPQPPMLSYDGKFIAVAASNPFDDNTMVTVFDSQSGAEVGKEDVPVEELKIFAVDSKNKQLITYQKGRGREPGKLEFRNFDQLGHPVKVWETGSFFDRDGFMPKFGQFVGPEKLLTVGKRISLWDTARDEAIYSVKVNGFSLERNSVTVSPNGDYMALAERNAVRFVDIATGKSLGAIKTKGYTRALTVSPSGEYFAMLDVLGVVSIFDLATKELAQSFSTNARHALHWVDDRHLIADSHYLYDVEYRVCVWEYSEAKYDSLTRLGEGNFLFQQKKNLLPVKLPHADFSDKLDELDPEELLILRPGEEIAIDYDLPFDEATQIKIRKRLEQRLAAAGVSINAQSNIVLKGRVTTLPKKTSRITDSLGFGFGMRRQRRNEETVTYTPSRSSIQLIKDGKSIWRRSSYHGPAGILDTKEGESSQAYVDRVSKPHPNLFLEFKIPVDRAVLPGGKPFGKSDLGQAVIK